LDRKEENMKTGCFAKCATLKGAVSISNGVPNFYRGPQYKKVAPRWNMLKMPREEYDYEFGLILEKLDPEEVYRDLTYLGGEDPILLCWEKPNQWCHRRRVAEWLENSLPGSIIITEYGFERTETLPYFPPIEPKINQLELF
jgi:hypothetical protein